MHVCVCVSVSVLDTQKPATLEEAVEHMVALRLEAEKKLLASEYSSKEVSSKKHVPCFSGYIHGYTR